MSEQNEVEQIKKEITPVATASVRKRTGLSYLKNAFIVESSETIKSYLITEAINIAKNMVSNIASSIKDSIDIMIFGSKTNKSSSNMAGKVSYSSYYAGKSRFDTPQPEQAKIRYHYDEVILDSRIEAEEVIDRLNELIEYYGQATVADMYDLCNITGEYTDNNYGWKNLASAKPALISGGRYILKLPKPMPLEKR